ncbi:hypothetical protein [Enterococcus sp. HY326]|uniref:hypothetical protein n=1 Tax=Enterococcus sp. HY326 TaxID=2971265 RepID=UPI00223F962C|nr:hypothetical protein [Enterococcus sp. HY326]
MEEVQEFQTDEEAVFLLRLQNLVVHFSDEEYCCYKFLTFEEAEEYFFKTVAKLRLKHPE